MGASDPAAPNFPYVLPQPAGVEFAQESGMLRFYRLVPDGGGAFVRSQAVSEQGTVDQPSTTAGACFFWMAPDSSPGSQTRWTVERFKNPNELLVNGNDYYVPAP